MRKREREILEAIERGETSTNHPSDAFVKELRTMARYGWITLKIQENHMTQHGRWYIASYQLTEEGKKALAEA
jgi:hypothetical protein